MPAAVPEFANLTRALTTPRWLLPAIFWAGVVWTIMVCAAGVQAGTLQGVRIHEAPDSTRVVFDITEAVEYKVFRLQNPERVVVDLFGVQPKPAFDPAGLAAGRERIAGLRAAPRAQGYRVVIDTKSRLDPKAFKLKPIQPYGHRLVVDLYDANRNTAPPPQRPLAADRDVIIAIDAGHGGDDPGAIGPNGLHEKLVVLQISRRVVKHLNSKRGFKGVLIRDGDYYLTHRRRTELARESRADLFVSIHADAFRSAKVSGASVYTLSDRGATSETAAWLAQRENRSDLLGGVGDVSLDDKDPLLAQVILDLSMEANRSQSIDAGKSVLANLGRVTNLHKNRVEQAAFVVLKSPDMPSMLVETGFISNPTEARRLGQSEHQSKVARAIANGIEQYMRSQPPLGTWLAKAAETEDLRYTIVRGDTISTIAERYGLSSRQLKAHNRLGSDKIRIGQVILIPGIGVSGSR
ncbi:MAG: N-acetylmuramoyl-L-alanine amidase [Pseudomonadota bacterium]